MIQVGSDSVAVFFSRHNDLVGDSKKDLAQVVALNMQVSHSLNYKQPKTICTSLSIVFVYWTDHPEILVICDYDIIVLYKTFLMSKMFSVKKNRMAMSKMSKTWPLKSKS